MTNPCRVAFESWWIKNIELPSKNECWFIWQAAWNAAMENAAMENADD